MKEKKVKKIELHDKLIQRIFLNEAPDIGVFMSILAYEYIKICDISIRDYLKSMENSLKKLQKWEEKDERIAKNNE